MSNQWRPDICPITGRAFFMWIEHPELGNVPTYGGPLDSYTIPTKDGDGEFSCERYDHDFGGWVESECLGLYLIDDEEQCRVYELEERIAELEASRAALAAENAGIKSAIPEPRDIEDDNDNMDDVSLAEDFGFNHAVERMRRQIPETPTTDAFLAEVRAQGLEMFAQKCNSKSEQSLASDIRDNWKLLGEHATDFAAELRKGE
ncbi:ead/Ea22-like family protein [Escherichia coli]